MKVNKDIIHEERIAKTSSILEKLKEIYRDRVIKELNKLDEENLRLAEQFNKEENTRKKIRELIVREVHIS
jgi:vacuolar-type H+-ATPase subunit I/STV1